MKRDTRQRLFEVMSRLDKTFKPKLNESRLYVKVSDIPSQIVSWANSIIGRGFENRITIEKSKDTVTIDSPWHDADRETHQIFKLVNDNAEAVGNAVSKTGWSETSMYNLPDGTIKIPSGFVLATVGTYPKRLKISVSDDAMDMLGNSSEILDKLSDDAIVALNNAGSLKSAYRQKFDISVYQELISLGLLTTQKAMTIEGKNAIKSQEAIDRLTDIKNKDEEENGWSPKYKITI